MRMEHTQMRGVLDQMAQAAKSGDFGAVVDHGDTLMLRDTGWVQIYCTDNQEVFDSILAAFRLAEDPNLLLPVMVHQSARLN